MICKFSHPRATAVGVATLFVLLAGAGTAPSPAGGIGRPVVAREDLPALAPSALGVDGLRRLELDRRGSLARVVVEVDGDAAAVGNRIRRTGGRVELRAGRLLQAWVPVGGIEALAADAVVERVRPPARFLPSGVPGEGVSATNASAWQAVGLTARA